MSDRLIKVMDKFAHDMAIVDLQRAYRSREGGDLSYHDTLYLNIITAHPDKYTSSQIADLLKVSRPAVTQKINELAKKGYVIRRQSDTDKRVFYLSVSPTKAYYTEDDRIFEYRAANMLEEKFGVKQVETMCEMLEFLTETFYNEGMNG